MSILQAAVLGLVQGLAEFLPVSSSGHLILARLLMRISDEAAATGAYMILDVLLHAGTLLGAVATGLLPESVSSALGVAIYGMFIAIIVPPAKKDKAALLTILLAIVLSCLLRAFTPLSSGWVIIICAVVAASVSALLFPIREVRS